MKRVLIVSPHFPPTDAADMHRVRTSLPYYRENGWDPIVLCVAPEHAGRVIDERLLSNVPDDVEVNRVNPIPEKWLKGIGITALGIRAYWALRRAGNRLLSGGGIDLVFFSTTQFISMAMAPGWSRAHGVPFVLDFQDPWFAGADDAVRPVQPGSKHRLMRKVHRHLESRTVPRASGLIATSALYIEELRARYRLGADVPAEEIPFGFETEEFSNSECKSDQTLLYLGVVTLQMEPALRELFATLRELKGIDSGSWSGLKLQFIGTSYVGADNEGWIKGIAQEVGYTDSLSVSPARISFPEAQKELANCCGAIVLGQPDEAYRPSKLAGLLYSMKPIALVGISDNLSARFRDLPSVAIIRRATTKSNAQRLLNALITTPQERELNRKESLEWEASRLTKKQCELFERVVRH